MNRNLQILSIFRMAALLFSECFCIIKILLCRLQIQKAQQGNLPDPPAPPHILSHSTVKDSAFRLVLSSQSFQSQASENSPKGSRDLGKRNGSTSNIPFGKYSFAWEFFSHFLDKRYGQHCLCHKEPCRVDANKKNMIKTNQ